MIGTSNHKQCYTHKRPITFLPFLLLRRHDLKRELQLAVVRRWHCSSRKKLDGKRARENFWEYCGQILANYSFQSESLHVILPHFDDILRSEDPRTLENFKNTGAIRDHDLVQILSLAMQVVDLNYRQFIVAFSLEYEACPYRDSDDGGDWGYLPK